MTQLEEQNWLDAIEKDEKALDQPLFNRKHKEGGSIFVKDNMQRVNYMPYIKDELKIVGRNNEI